MLFFHPLGYQRFGIIRSAWAKTTCYLKGKENTKTREILPEVENFNLTEVC